MRLRSLRLQNFRQHADTTIVFDSGLTGIIGPNGAGKSTVLEGIAYALYGNTAARGNRDSIRFNRAEARAIVRVELEFSLAGHTYVVKRGLNAAELFLDGGEQPIANSITGVTELLQKRLGMSCEEFHHTYFTRQKQLDVMATFGPSDRAKFLSRVLGNERLTTAQELVRRRRRDLTAEMTGLRQGMTDAESARQLVSEAEARLAVAQRRSMACASAKVAAATRLAEIEPQWAKAQQERERTQQVIAELRIAESEWLAHGRDVERLDAELTMVEAAHRELAPLVVALAVLPTTREQLTALDQLAQAEAERQRLLERERGAADEESRLAERATALATAPALEAETQQALALQRAVLADTERTLENERTTWARDRQEVETRLHTLETQVLELEGQVAKQTDRGAEALCPTCGRPLGTAYLRVLELLVEQLETMRVDANYNRQRALQLAKPHEQVTVLEAQRRAAQHSVQAAERRLTKIHAAIVEAGTIAEQRESVAARLDHVRSALSALPTGYDGSRHASLRADVARLLETQTRAARLSGLADREGGARAERAQAFTSREASHQRVQALQSQRADRGLDDEAFAAAREAHERAAGDARRAELDDLAATADVRRSQGELDAGRRRLQELARLQEAMQRLEDEKRYHDELDRGYADLRTDVNVKLRPELAEIASQYLDALTDGRYSTLAFDDDYSLHVVEAGVPKPVISGGEEDLCNLVLRLAISQMIADRAGQAFSLLVLDEVFGSLDETRRENVLDLLRRLSDRFEQVIVITHIEQVRDGFDHTLQIRFDEVRGASVVTVASSRGVADEQFEAVA